MRCYVKSSVLLIQLHRHRVNLTARAPQVRRAPPAAAQRAAAFEHQRFFSSVKGIEYNKVCARRRFAERHRRLLNALLRQNAALLERSLAPLLRAPRLIDFDNKRAHFRARVRASGEDRGYGTLRICVRREHVFEDSFHQLRMRCASR